MKAKKLLWIIPAVLLFLVILAAVCGWILFGAEITASGTIKRLGDDLWYMEFDGDYGFDGYIERGGSATDGEMAVYITEFLTKGFYKPDTAVTADTPGVRCSTLAARDAAGAQLFGRNFDWDDCAAVIVKTVPRHGYASLSTVNLDFLGFGEDFTPDADMQSRFLTLAAAYVPLDGMNEKGLCVADLVIEAEGLEPTHQDTALPDLTTVGAIRLLLDRAATTDEAVALLGQFDMNSSANMVHHLSISDASGKSVVVEYIGSEMTVTETDTVTNFILAQGEYYGAGSDNSMSSERYDTLKALLAESGGVLGRDGVLSALRAVSCGELNRGLTQWSVVYDKTALTLDFYHRENYSSALTFSLGSR